MVGHEGGRWDVGAEGDAVYLERISEGDERLFDDLLSPQEAREFAGLLTKYADKADEAATDDRQDDSDDSGDEREDSEDEAEESGESEDTDDTSDDSDKSDD
ncbi:hypothetical protein [Mycobacterium arosiense]|uniref:Uncharacterized protein n=1 Tax=Mycobacterium arosiense ATCC BAA-1401 = DSM 45069 TaxID=1265311 RepID=A0A1W9ZHS8_MYCAI|nr:hypothetical protein [Mycobacterium arosiense]ORA15666.1 hypothetical protein BST14_11445 [Mycobacterium arosiense ATCC BAA-1401 = DSM 45069]